jgi:hypothetical protein
MDISLIESKKDRPYRSMPDQNWLHETEQGALAFDDFVWNADSMTGTGKNQRIDTELMTLGFLDVQVFAGRSARAPRIRWNSFLVILLLNLWRG